MAAQSSAQVNGDDAGSNVDIEAIVIGAGFGGLRMLYELRKLGVSGRIFESATGVGGTWYWNRYPGARTDSESWVYVLTFLEELGMEWTPKERFPRQPEVEEYLNKITDYLDLRKDIQLNTKIVAAHRDEEHNTWKVATEGGEKFTCRFLIAATGPLATPIDPPFPGLESYQGEVYRTGLWPNRKVDFAGKRVGVIGTGATAVQVIPAVAHTAKSLTVFQRTPNFVMPSRNHPLTEEQATEIKRDYPTILKRARTQVYGFDMVDASLMYESIKDDPKQVERVLEAGWEKGGFRYVFETFGDILLSPESNEAASAFVRNKIRTIVKDEKTAELLCPNYPILSKRPPLGHFYYETFNRDNVELVDLNSNEITEMTPTGLKTKNQDYDFDIVIFAIGFDSITGTLGRIDIRSTENERLSDVLKQKLQTAYGITLSGFPNFFMIFGPQAPFANGPLIIDLTADWIGKTMSHMKAEGHDRVESTEESGKQWSDHVNEVFNSLVIRDSAVETRAWNVGANVEGKGRTSLFYVGGVPAYTTAIDKERAEDYPSFTFSNAVKAA